jgi:colanic acid/amylovoran biosynthesis protein
VNIIISHVYSADNKGDAALLGLLIQEVRNEFPEAQITILTLDKIKDTETFDGVPVRHSFMYFSNIFSQSKAKRLLYATSMIPLTLGSAFLRGTLHIKLPLNKNWDSLIDLYANADLIIPVGGGYMRTNKNIGSLYDFTLLMHPLVLAKLLKKPTVLYSQSVGPFFRKIESKMLAHILKHDVEVVIVREDTSFKLLQSMGVKNIIRSVDTGFLLKGEHAKRVPDGALAAMPSDKLIIGVTARKWLDASSQAEYELAIAKTLEHLIAKHKAFIVLVPQVTAEFHGDDDRLVSKAIHAKIANKDQALVLTKNYDYHDIKAIYGKFDFMLGTRFHSVIFSLTSYVPALAIEYEHKTSGIMHDLGLDQWVVKIEDVDPLILCAKMDELISQKAAYKKHLKQVLPAYIQKAHQAIKITHQALLDFNS